ncbi:MAG: type VI secretion system tip protein TssI/VgrG [Planctomycetota bacterium]
MPAERYDTEHRMARVTSPLDSDSKVFRLESLRGSEGISQLFSYEVVVSSETLDVSFEDLAGKIVTVSVKNASGKERHFSGHVTGFRRELQLKTDVSKQMAYYRLELSPWIWFLDQRSDCRIFHDKDGNNTENKVTDIVKAIINDAGMSSSADYGSWTEGDYPNLVYCVQYNETDLAFMSRLLERFGIFYFFEHSEGDYKLVFGDSTTAYAPVEGYDEMLYMASGTGAQTEHISNWALDERIGPTKLTARDHWYKTPTETLEEESTPQGDTVSDPVAKRELFEYPGQWNVEGDAEKPNKARLELARQRCKEVAADADALGVVPGYRFKIEVNRDASDDEDAEASVAGSEQAEADEWVVIESEIQIDRGDEGRGEADEVNIDQFFISFRAIPASQVFRPERVTPTPRAQGPHIATVVGEDGEEITTNELGQIQVCFPWDRKAKKKKDDSCWIRVKQQWADKGFGAQFIPRHGQEVVVEYIDGNLDRPLVTGCVYHEDNGFPFDPSSEKNKSGWKSKSTKEGGDDNFHEISFVDTKDEELLFIQAEKDREVIVKNNDVQQIGVDKADPGDQEITIENMRTVTINSSDDNLTVSSGNHNVEITSGDENITVGGNQVDDVTGDITVTSGGSISIEAATEIKLTVGGSSITIDSSSITISTTTVTVEGTGTAELTGASTTVNGDGSLELSGGICRIN